MTQFPVMCIVGLVSRSLLELGNLEFFKTEDWFSAACKHSFEFWRGNLFKIFKLWNVRWTFNCFQAD